MKELFTDITLRNGEVKKIKVELEDELAEWLVTQPEEVYRDFLLFEYKSKCVERKETRRTQSLDASLSNGFEVPDEDADVHLAVLRKMTCEQVRKAIQKLEPQQQWLIKEVFFNYIHYPKIVQPKLEAYSDEEVEQLMEALENEDIRTRALLTLAVTTGMRRGELVGLMWDDIDFDKQIITISRSVYKPKGEEQRIKATKSVSSNRTVYIPESCSRILYELKIQQASDKRHSQGVWLDSGFVFTDKYGKNISLYAPTRICAEVQAKYGLRHLKLHGLRHTCGSLMVEHGVDPETVKTVLGHESLKTTNRYLHPYAESMKDASEKMERIIRGKTDGETPIHLSGGE